MSQVNELEKKLKESVSISDIGFHIAKVDRNIRKALAQPYLSSRALLDRLDDLCGIEGWYDSYAVLYNCVICKLSIKLGDDWISKEGAASFAESLDEASSYALSQAAVKFGIGRDLMNLPDIYVDIMESKPENSKNEVHFYRSDELSGWWEEPDRALLTEGNIDASESEPDYKELTLPQKLDLLLKLGIIRKKKYDNYFKKINDTTTAQGLLRYFERQFDLLHRLYVLAGLNKMSDDTRATIYKRIMASKMADFPVIDNELKTMEAA